MPKSGIGTTLDLKKIDPKFIPHVLGEGELGAALEWMVTDPNGKVTEHGIKKSESFVQQFLQVLFSVMVLNTSTNPLPNVRDTGNALRNIDPGAYITNAGYTLDVLAGATNAAFGIVVGTDTGVAQALTIASYSLGTLIAHGAGAGAMQYGAVTFGLPGADATTSQFTVTRNFTANVGGITVNEIGLYCRSYDGSTRYFMIIRDLIGGGIAVPNGQTLTVNYRLQGTV